jgi:crotonobetainyl-CoA:carnitine CoA-transferase CaiB-like acyl-CoA transferase
MFVDMGHPKAGKTNLTGTHIKLSATPARLRSPAPQLGVLDLTADKLAQLQLDGQLVASFGADFVQSGRTNPRRKTMSGKAC